MQVNTIIAEVRECARGASYTDEQLIKWLRELDGRIYNETLKRYEDAPEYTPIEDCESSLLISEEYADVYRYFLLSRIYLTVGDHDRYNAYAELFATALDSFRCGYIKHHMPKRVDFSF